MSQYIATALHRTSHLQLVEASSAEISFLCQSNGEVEMREFLKRARTGDAEVGLEDEPSTRLRTFASGGRKCARTLGAYFQSLYLPGRISAPEFQEGAAAGSASGSTDALVREDASVGHRGRHRGNCHRDVVSKLSMRCDKPPLYSTHIPFWDMDKHERTMQTCYFLLPHEIVEWVLSKASDMSDYFEMSDASRQRTFEAWKHNFGLVGHHAVACGPWGGAATSHTRDQMYLVLMNSMTKHGHGVALLALQLGQKKWLVHAAASADVHTNAVFAVLSWSFSELLAGKYSWVRERWQKLQILTVDRSRLEVARCWHELESERWGDTKTRRLELGEERAGAHKLDTRRCGKEVLQQMFRKFHVAPVH